MLFFIIIFVRSCSIRSLTNDERIKLYTIKEKICKSNDGCDKDGFFPSMMYTVKITCKNKSIFKNMSYNDKKSGVAQDKRQK